MLLNKLDRDKIFKIVFFFTYCKASEDQDKMKFVCICLYEFFSFLYLKVLPSFIRINAFCTNIKVF